MSKKEYVANTGIDFEGLKPPVRVEKDEPIPARLKQEEIKDLLDANLIREEETEE